jgi:S-adenosylmethionine-diacylglycerol 3-amino-3-carboxypropyl transferase
MTQVNRWLGTKFFKFIHNNSLIYNTCWEDPQLDREALQINQTDQMMMITSAGCNALDYALLKPDKIYAVDVNPKQNALLELKIAGIKSLEFEDFFSLFGQGKHDDFARLYLQKMRPHLSTTSQKIWDRQQSYFQSTSFRPSFYFRGSSGTIARLFNLYIDFKNLRNKVNLLFEASSLQEQAELYSSHFKKAIWSSSVKWAVSSDVALSLVGVPRAQRNQIENNYDGGIAAFIEDCIESVFTRVSLKDNYFWWLYLNGEYTKSRCPEYLKEHNFNQLKDNLSDRISVHSTSILDFLSNHQGQISKFVLLDHMDWLCANNYPILKSEWQTMIDHATKDARFIWRSGGLSADFIDCIPVRKDGKTVQISNLLKYDYDLAEKLHKTDRVHTYGSFHIAKMTNPEFAGSLQ